MQRRKKLRILPLIGIWGAENTDTPVGARHASLGTIIGQFKSAVTKRIKAMRNTRGQTIGQRNDYERVKQNECVLHELRSYIQNNPKEWDLDEENPAKPTPV